jgi:threonine/homoserine/homoserine lactone efflux protein
VSSIVAVLASVAARAVFIVTPGLDTALVLRTTAIEGSRRAAGTCRGLFVRGLGAVLVGVGLRLATE